MAGIESPHALVADHPPATPRPTRCWSGSRPTAAHGCRRWSLPANRLVLSGRRRKFVGVRRPPWSALVLTADGGEGGRRGRWRWTSSRKWSRWRCGAARRRRAGPRLRTWATT